MARSSTPGLISGYVADAGLLTMSRYPIVEQEFRPFKNSVFRDYYIQKGILYTKIVINNYKILHLFNTNTQETYSGYDNKSIVINLIFNLFIENNFRNKIRLILGD